VLSWPALVVKLRLPYITPVFLASQTLSHALLRNTQIAFGNCFSLMAMDLCIQEVVGGEDKKRKREERRRDEKRRIGEEGLTR